MESKGKALAAIAIVALLLAVSMWALLGNTKTDQSVTLIDARDRQVTIASTPKSIISCSPAITEMIYSFGANDTLVGCTSYCNYPSAVVSAKENGTIKVIGNFYTKLDTEQIINISVSPCVVFMEESVENSIQQISKLEDAGLKVVVLKTSSGFDAISYNFDLMGKALHKESKAKVLEGSMQAKLSAVSDKVSVKTDKPSVMVIIYWDTTSIWVAGSSTSINEVILEAGGINAMSSVSSYGTVDADKIYTQNPDIIIICGMAGDASVAIEQLKSNSVLKDVKAVQNESVYVLLGQAENTLVRQGERLVEGTYLMAMMIYPDLFTTTLPHTLSSEYEQYLPSSW